MASRAMNPHLLLLLLSLAKAVPPSPGAPLAGELRCRCVQTVTEVIPPRRLAGLELIPAGPHCAVPEVIATTKAGKLLCLNHSAPWVQLLITRLLPDSENEGGI
uniref:C-X-C motif chemokine n=1 Tax=Cairina moschata TaxID=8855 RepID=A0A8C3CP63_CAIMO